MPFGTFSSGKIKTGMEIKILPGKILSKIKTLELGRLYEDDLVIGYKFGITLCNIKES